MYINIIQIYVWRGSQHTHTHTHIHVLFDNTRHHSSCWHTLTHIPF